MSGHSSRGAVADRVRAALRGDDRLVVLHVAGVAGVGKTRLLKRLGDDAGAGARVLRVDFARVAATNAEAEQQLLSSYREILESLARGLSAPDLPARLREHQNEVGAGRATVDVARAEMRDAFLDAIGDDGPPILQLGDDLSSLTLNALAEWLLELLQGMSDRAQVVAVLTSRLPPRVEYPGRFERITLGELERDEAAAVLVEAGAGAWVDAVERWCGFYPAAVDVAASLARTAPDRPELLDDRRALEPWAARLVEPITTSLEVNDRAAVEAAAVLRTFDASLVRHALTYEGGDVRPDLEAWLGALPFVETLPDGRLRARPFLRLLLPERLRAEPPRRPHELGSRLTEIRAKVAAAYTQLVVGDAQGRSYRMWLTLEDRREQERQVEFVYHSVRTEYGPLDLAYVYFEAFWWWGAYVESDFCRRLPAVARAMLEEWRPDAVGDDAELLRRSEELVSALDAFAEATPPEKSGRPSDPAASLRAIGRIELLAGLERTPVGDQASHVHAILEIQRAAALQQRDLASGEVDASLGRARTLFGKSKGDAWCMPWVDVYEASLWAERGRQGKAAETATLGLTLAEKAAAADRDFEVEANLHMAIAECLDGRERPKALRHLARAVFCAYCFTSMPDLPDVYTQAFYGDIVGRALDRIREIPKPDDRRRACDGLLEFWSPYWELAGGEPAASGSVESLLERQSDDLALCLFPPGPSDDDLEQDGDYARTVEAVHERLDAEAAAARAFGDGGGLRGRLPGRRAGRAEEPAAVPALELPAEPPEPDDLFEPAGDPVWPDHWRTFPAAWRELADDRAREIVARAKADLPDTWREVLERRDVQGRSYEDVARGLGVSRADQTLMLGHARARIRRALAEHFEEGELTALEELACRAFVDSVAAYLEGDLDERAATSFEQHSLVCEGCARYFDQIRTTIALVSADGPGRAARDDVRREPVAAGEYAYKFLGPGGVGPFSGFPWAAGVWVAATGPPRPCRRGIHACAPGDLPFWLGEELWVIELAQPVVPGPDKLVAPAGRLVRRVEAWNGESALEFARDCAARVRARAVDALGAAGLGEDAARVREAPDDELRTVLEEVAGRAGTARPACEYAAEATPPPDAPPFAAAVGAAYTAALAAAQAGGAEEQRRERALQAAWLERALGLDRELVPGRERSAV